MTGLMQHRDWGFGTDRAEHWSQRGVCATDGADPDIWTEITDKEYASLALHYCRSCPVIDQCRNDAEGRRRTPDRYRQVVAGGVYWDSYGEPRRWA